LTPKIENLKDVREKLLGYSRETAARLSRIAVERLASIEERGEVPTVFEADALSRIYGIDADLLADEPIQLAPGDGVVTLASRNELRGLDDVTRVPATNRELVERAVALATAAGRTIATAAQTRALLGLPIAVSG